MQAPRFRQDLVAEAIDDNGRRFVDVMAPDTGSVFRLFEVEFALACAMDGERDVAGIVRWARDELGLAVATNEVSTIIATLGDLGYLDHDGVARAAAAAPVDAMPITDSTIPTPAPRVEDGLAPGIVVGAARPPIAPVSDIELGHVAVRAPVDHASSDAPDYGLGQPGATRRPVPPAAPVEDIPLGASGRGDFESELPTKSSFEGEQATDVSMDLSADMAIRPDDVKEAVRQSQVLRAVDVPPELLEAVEPVITREPSPAPLPTPVPRPMVEVPRPARPEPRVQQRPERAEPTPRPTPRPEAKPSAPQRALSPWLIVALIIVIVGAGAFAVYRYVLQKSDNEEASVAPRTPAPAPAPPPKPVPPPPPAETGILASEAQPALDIKPTIAQTLESIPAKDTVKKGDIVAYFVGHGGVERQIAALQKDIDRNQRELDDAHKKLDAAGSNAQAIAAAEGQVKNRSQALDDKHKTFVTRTAELEKYVLLAPTEGKLVAVAKPNTRVTPDDVIARIERAPLLVATLKSAASASTGAAVVVKAKEATITCRVVEVDAKGAKIACPADTAREGLEIAFDHVDASAPAPKNDAEIEMVEEAAGSAAGSAKKP